jgi:4'-phosphopantetheinyl transferase
MKTDVIVRCWRLDASESEIRRIETMLSADEIGRASAMRISGKRDRFVAAHAGLRTILGREIGRAPSEIAFALGPKGKPSLADPGDVRFNLSHSDDLAALAVCRGFEIGVDVERVRHIDGVERIAERFFAERESQAVLGAVGDLQDRLFMRFWTCKEAYLKATGDGLSRPFDEVVVAMTGGGEVECLRDASGARLGVSICTFEPTPGYVGALVARAEDVSVRVEQWRFER